MIPRPRSAPLLLLALLWICGLGCNDNDSPAAPTAPDPLPEQAMPDFQLPDVNPNSATFGTAISPRDQLARISAWYFTAST